MTVFRKLAETASALRLCALGVVLLSGALGTSVVAQVRVLKQRALGNWGIPAADYSAITPLGGCRYAVVSDKERRRGFHVWRIIQKADGRVKQVVDEGFAGDTIEAASRDCESVACVLQRGLVYIGGEADQRVPEYDMEGCPTGRELKVPDIFSTKSIRPNAGFEAMCYDTMRDLLWLTTECALRADGPAPGMKDRESTNLLRLQAFTPDLRPATQYLYRTDAPEMKREGRLYVLGVSALCALPDGRLLVLEREVNVPPRYVGAKCRVKVYAVNPVGDAPLPLPKQLVASFATGLTLTSRSFANYEGMCLGAPTADGRPTVLLVSDSQSGAGRKGVHLKDYIKVLVL